MTLKVDGTNGLLQAYDYQVLTTGFTYTFAAGTQLLLAVPAGTLATGTVTMPASPVDGMNITITSTQQITALTVNGNTGQSIVGGSTSLKAGGSQTFVYRLANTTWYNQNNNASVSVGYTGDYGQVFTANGTFTIPDGVTAVKVTVVGGGGGGGGASSGAAGGGGGGGAAIKYLTGLTPGNTLTVTRGAGGTAGGAPGNGGTGGTSSVASGTQTISTISATGGAGSTSGTGSAPLSGAAGGVGSGGDMNMNGGGGGASFYEPTASFAKSGAGGSSIFGGGGRGGVGALAGAAGGAYGGGAGGSSSFPGAGNIAGAAGGAGVVVFEW